MHMQGDRGRRAYAATGARLSAIAVSIVRLARGRQGRFASVPGCECVHSASYAKPKTVRVHRGRAQPLRALWGHGGERCDAPVDTNDLPFLLPFCFPSPRTRLKSPLAEPRSCCQATRLPASRDLINSDSVMQVAIANVADCRMDGQQTHACVQMHVLACAPRQDTECTRGRQV